jgi:hypothetical protein
VCASSAESPCMRRRLVAPVLAVGIIAAGSASAGTSPLQQRAAEVRWAIPAAAAYQADHRTWKGMTVAKLRRYYSIKNVVVRRATKTGFCLQTTKTPFVHYDGPAGNVRKARCGIKGAIVPFVSKPRPPAPPPAAAEQRIRNAVPAMEGYAADHSGYAGATIAGLHEYDTSVADITIVSATRDSYCIESGSGTDEYFKDGPGADIAPGACPAS